MICDVIAGAWGKNQRGHQFNSIQSVPVSFGLWDTALKFLSPGPRSDVTDHLDGQTSRSTVWANGTQNSGLVNCVPKSRLPFVQISSIFRKTTAKARNRYQIKDDFEEMGHEFPIGIFRPEKHCEDYHF